MTDEELELARESRLIDALLDRRCSRFFCDIKEGRVVHILSGEALRIVRHRRREEQELALLRRLIDQGFDIFAEPIRQHLVGFIQDDRLHIRKVEALSADMIQKAPGCPDDDMRVTLQLLQLVLDRASTDDICPIHTALDGKGTHHVKDLLGKFAGRCHDKHLRHSFVCFYALNDRQQIGQRLPCPSLRTADQITSLESVWDRRHLDGRRGLDPLCFQKFRQRLIHAERSKYVHRSSCKWVGCMEIRNLRFMV